MYEKHGAIEQTMEEDSRRLVPPVGLREATIGAALGTAVQTISGGIGAFLSTKIGLVVSTLLAGGIITGVVLFTGDDSATNDQTGSTQTEQAAPNTAAENQRPDVDVPATSAQSPQRDASGEQRRPSWNEEMVNTLKDAQNDNASTTSQNLGADWPDAKGSDTSINFDEDPAQMGSSEPIRLKSNDD
jgi:hypothetical protein